MIKSIMANPNPRHPLKIFLHSILGRLGPPPHTYEFSTCSWAITTSGTDTRAQAKEMMIWLNSTNGLRNDLTSIKREIVTKPYR